VIEIPFPRPIRATHIVVAPWPGGPSAQARLLQEWVLEPHGPPEEIQVPVRRGARIRRIRALAYPIPDWFNSRWLIWALGFLWPSWRVWVWDERGCFYEFREINMLGRPICWPVRPGDRLE